MKKFAHLSILLLLITGLFSSKLFASKSQLYFDCNLNGETAKMVAFIEVIQTHGATWGPGANPSINGVIADGGYTIYSEGELLSSRGHYRFSGENSFADFWDVNTYDRFRVQWVETPQGLDLIVNPFGDAPTRYSCLLTHRN